MLWTRPRSWPIWPTRLQSDRGWRPPACVFQPHPSCASPASPLVTRSSQGRPGLGGSFPHHFARPPPRPTPDCAAQAAAGRRGLWVWTQGGCATRGSEGHCRCQPLLPPQPGVLEPHWGHSSVPSSQHGLCMDMVGPYGSQAISSPSSSALGDPLMHRGAREGPYFGGSGGL